MALDNIEKLLEKYFEATTTVAEEETLKAYFSQEEVAKHLVQYAPMFQYFAEATKEQFTKEMPLVTLADNTTKRKFNYKWLSVAAVTLLMFGIYFGNDYRVKAEEERIATEFAYQETKKALDLLATNFSKGTEKVAYLNQFEETKRKIYNE
jgi:hypothetical protein